MYKRQVHYLLDRRQPNTTIPFVKGNELNYSSVMGLFGREARKYTWAVSYTHLRAHETVLDLVCRLLFEKKNKQHNNNNNNNNTIITH